MRLALVLGLAACGGSSGGDDDDAPDAQSSTTHSGIVFIQSFIAEQPPGTIVRGGTASATFSAAADSCTREQVGPCDISTCATVTAFTDAGTITITGALQAITLTPAVDHEYPQLTIQQPLFADGANLGFAAAGNLVPAFDESITAPTRATITSPAEPAAQLPIDRSQPFTITWSGGGSGQVQVSLFDNDFEENVSCRFAASAGTGTIPTDVLGRLAAGSGAFAMASIAETSVVAGDFKVFVQAYVNAVWVDESIVSGPTILQ